MKNKLTTYALAFLASFLPLHASALEGDEKLACEALLCLAASTRPAECTPSIRRYFSISLKTFSRTLRARANFLDLCPIGGRPDLEGMKSAILNGAGNCDAQALNQVNFVRIGEDASRIEQNWPTGCDAYFSNEYTGNGRERPVYIGTPDNGGHWVEKRDEAAALVAHQKMLQEQAAAAQQREQGY